MRRAVTCDVCMLRPADVDYRLLRPVDSIRWFCARCAVVILDVAPARDFERLETPLDRLHQLVSV